MLRCLVNRCRCNGKILFRSLYAIKQYNLVQLPKHAILGASMVLQQHTSSLDLKDVIKEKIPEEREKVIKLRKESGDVKIGEITIGMLLGGMRGMPALLSITSKPDPEKGILLRGYTIAELMQKLPKAPGGYSPLPEGVFWLLCTGDIPTQEQAKYVTKEWNFRAEIPQHVIDILLTFPKELHPMAQMSAALTSLSMCSKFAAQVNHTKKEKLWEIMYEDCMDLLSKITSIASIIYTRTYKECGLKPIIEADKDWSYNFCCNMGFSNMKLIDFMRLYLFLHCDHGPGNVSAHATHLVGSALSDCYLSMAAGINGLAGPLHGLASQTILETCRIAICMDGKLSLLGDSRHTSPTYPTHQTVKLATHLVLFTHTGKTERAWNFIIEITRRYGNNPADDKVKDFVQNWLESGNVVPGYGHAVLRATDPRYTAFKNYAEKYAPDDYGVKIVQQLHKVVPPILKQTKKVKNIHPNIDAHSGAILQHYKLTQMAFFTVLFAVSRSIGTMASLIWSRALGLPIERPKSLTLSELMALAKNEGSQGLCIEPGEHAYHKPGKYTSTKEQSKKPDIKKPTCTTGTPHDGKTANQKSTDTTVSPCGGKTDSQKSTDTTGTSYGGKTSSYKSTDTTGSPCGGKTDSQKSTDTTGTSYGGKTSSYKSTDTTGSPCGGKTDSQKSTDTTGTSYGGKTSSYKSTDTTGSPCGGKTDSHKSTDTTGTSYGGKTSSYKSTDTTGSPCGGKTDSQKSTDTTGTSYGGKTSSYKSTDTTGSPCGGKTYNHKSTDTTGTSYGGKTSSYKSTDTTGSPCGGKTDSQKSTDTTESQCVRKTASKKSIDTTGSPCIGKSDSQKSTDTTGTSYGGKTSSYKSTDTTGSPCGGKTDSQKSTDTTGTSCDGKTAGQKSTDTTGSLCGGKTDSQKSTDTSYSGFESLEPCDKTDGKTGNQKTADKTGTQQIMEQYKAICEKLKPTTGKKKDKDQGKNENTNGKSKDECK